LLLLLLCLHVECGGNLTADAGSVASPNWPYNYEHHQHCVWNITVTRHKVRVVVLAVIGYLLIALYSGYVQKHFITSTCFVLHFPVLHFHLSILTVEHSFLQFQWPCSCISNSSCCHCTSCSSAFTRSETYISSPM